MKTTIFSNNNNNLLKTKTIFTLLLLSTILFQTKAEKTSQNESLKKIATPESSKNWMQLKKPMKQNELLQSLKTVFNLDEKASFKNLKTETDDLGWTHYKVQQHQNGIPIEGAQYILHEKDGLIQKANGNLVDSFCKNEQAAFNKEEAIQKILKQVNAKKYAWEDAYFENLIKNQKKNENESLYPQPELVYLNPKFDDNASEYRLCYKMEVATIEPFEHYVYYVNATTGIIEHKINQIHNCFNSNHANVENNPSEKRVAPIGEIQKDSTDKRKSCEEGTGLTHYDGTVNITTEFANGQYTLENYCLDGPGEGIITQQTDNSSDFCCASPITDTNNSWINESQKDGVSVFWATELFYNYFWQYHNRNSTDGNGEMIIGITNAKNPVNCQGDNCWGAYYWLNQAWFSGATPSYQAPVSVDIIGHSFTHGLILKSANLLYQSESGALNESFADIFGVVVERLMTTNLNGLDWLAGEDVRTLRNISNPNQYFDPDTYNGTYWYDILGCSPFNGTDYCGVHTNSGVQNYWFYLLSEGGSGVNDNGTNYNVSGIGIVDAAKIAYRNLTSYLNSNSDYADAEQGSIEAAIDLFGPNSNEVQQVKNAWKAVGLANDLETPETTDVYPGDLNHDGFVDNIDFVLKDAYLYNSGIARASEHQNTNWYAHPSEDWGVLQFNGKDIKHHDCNGDGIIDESDYEAIDENWELEWTEEADTTTAPSESAYQIRFYPIEDLNPSYLRMNIALENVTGGDLVLDRAYFTLRYNDLADNITLATFNFTTFPWIGVQNIDFESTVEHYPSDKEIKVGFKRTDGANSVGSGIIGELTLLLDESNNARSKANPCIINFEAVKMGAINNASQQTLLKNQQLQVNLCEGTCQTNWYINETQFQNEFKSTNLIETDGFLIIGEEQQVNYQSNRVCLRSGFRVKAGASFRAGNGDCN